MARLETSELPSEITEIKLYFQPPSYQGGLSDYLMQTLGYSPTGQMVCNSAVFACLHRLCTDYPEPPLRIYKGDSEGGDPQVQVDHPVEELVAYPNDSLTGHEVWYWTQWAKHVDGNAYWRKIRGIGGTPVELWPVSPCQLWPVTTKADRAAGVFISYYAYAPDPQNKAPDALEHVPVEDIVHFRLGLDPNDFRLGVSPLKTLVREVMGDDEAAKWTEALLKNFAIPGLLLTIPREESRTFTKEMAVQLKAEIRQEFSSENRGHVGVLKGGAKMEQFGFSPDQLNLTDNRRLFEERVSAVLGVPLAVVGLGGSAQNATHSNLRELRESYTESTLIPLYGFDAARITQQLLPDFTGTTSNHRLFARFDIAKMRALQEDIARLWARLDKSVQVGWIKKSEARSAAGYPPDEAEFDVPPAPPLPVQPQSLPGDPTSAPVANGALPDARRNGSANRIFNPSLNPSLNAAPLPYIEERALRHPPVVTTDNIAEMLDAVVQQAVPGLERDMKTYFAAQRKRLLDGLDDHPAVQQVVPAGE